MNRLVNLYGWIVVTSARRRELVASALFSSLLIAVISAALGFLWIAALPDGETIRGYDAVMMVWYVAIAESAVHSVDQRLMVRIGEDLRRGEVTVELLRPVTVVWMLVARNLGRAITRFGLIFPACCIVAWLLAGSPPSWWALMALMVTGPLAILVQMLIVIAASSSALWLGDTTATWFVFQKLVFLAGGMLLPLDLWPGMLGDVLTVLPWASTAYVPANVAVAFDAGRAAWLVALQVGWVAALAAVTHVAWARGEWQLLQGAGA